MDIIFNPACESLIDGVSKIIVEFDSKGQTIYKARNTIKVFDINGRSINVKKYKVPSLFNRIVYTFFRKAKAIRAYRYSEIILERGFTVPDPIAVLITRRNMLMTHSFYVSRQMPFGRNMYEFGSGGISGREEIIRQFARYTASLHEAGILHRDYSPGNILFDKKDDRVEFCLVDINRARFGYVSIRRGCANFARLWGNDEIFTLIADEYARSRNVDAVKCRRLVFSARKRFWKKYARKHNMPF
jgi:serine/threonine protein kinase